MSGTYTLTFEVLELGRLGEGQRRQGNLEQAEALEFRRTALPRDEEALAADMVALAAVLDGLEKFNESERLYAHALAIFRSNPSANAREIAVALSDLGAFDCVAAIWTRRKHISGARSR